MKNTKKILSAILISTVFMACNSNKDKDMAGDSTVTSESEFSQTEVKVVPGTYTDLNTGETVYIIMDPNTGWAIDSIKKVPVEFYLNNAGDTLFQNGLVVNYAIMKADGKWMLDETKIKRDGDEIKIKFDNGDKIKIDGEEMKIKDEDGKIKVEDDTIKVKPNN